MPLTAERLPLAAAPTVPVWVPAQKAVELYGVPTYKLLELAKAGFIRARKLEPDSRSSRTVYRCADIDDWLLNDAPKVREEKFEFRGGGRGSDCRLANVD